MSIKDGTPEHPGRVLEREFMRKLRITQTKLAAHLGWTHAKVNEIINGKRGITPKAALALSDALGTLPDYWLDLQKDFELAQARRNHKRVPRLRTV
jgi:addiction module HigA family antidote